MNDIVFLDIETTGVHPERLAWEIAMIRRKPDGIEASKLIQISPINLSKADPFGLKIGRFYERHLDYNPGFAQNNTVTEIYNEFTAAEVVEAYTRDAHIVGAVPNFDTETLDLMLRRHGFIPAWHYHLVDVENLAIGYLQGIDPGAKFPLPWKSDELSRAIGVEPPSDEERHTAMGDVRWAMRIYDKVMGNA